MNDGVNERLVDKRFDHFTRRRHQALQIIQLRLNESRRLENAMKNSKLILADPSSVLASKHATQFSNGVYLGWPPAIRPPNTAVGMSRGGTKFFGNTANRVQTSGALQGRREKIATKYTS